MKKLLLWLRNQYVTRLVSIKYQRPETEEAVVLSLENPSDTWIREMKNVYSEPQWEFVGIRSRWKLEWLSWYTLGIVAGNIAALWVEVFNG